jgi:hypothetical protein
MQGAGEGCGPCPEKRTAEFEGKRIEVCPHKPPTVDGKPVEISGAVIDEANRLQAALSRDEKRLAFIGGLCAKAETSHLKKIEALVILQGTLAEMLAQTIPGLVEEAEKVEPGSIARFNADLMVEIAKEVQAEALRVIDHAMANSKLIVVPR